MSEYPKTLSTLVKLDALRKMDEALSELSSLNIPKRLESHLAGMYYLDCAIILVQRYINDCQKEIFVISAAVVFLAAALKADISLQFWFDGGARKVVAGRLLELISDVIDVNCCLQNSSNLDLVQLLFSEGLKRSSSKSYIENHGMFTLRFNLGMLEDLDKYGPEFVRSYSDDLGMLLWFLTRYLKKSGELKIPFKLPWEEDESPDTSDQKLDMTSFIYASLYCLRLNGECMKGKFFQAPNTFNMNIARNQETWWKSAVNIWQKRELSTSDRNLYENGIKTIRCIWKYGMDAQLAMLLGNTFANEALKRPESSRYEIEKRAALYYEAVLKFMPSYIRRDCEIIHFNTLPLFSYAGRSFNGQEISINTSAASAFVAYHNISKQSYRLLESVSRSKVLNNAGLLEVNVNIQVESSHFQWLFNQILADKKHVGMVKLTGQDGYVEIPFFLLYTVWPLFKKIADHTPDVFSSFDIIIPGVSYSTLKSLRNLITAGSVCGSIDCITELQSIELIKSCKLSLESQCDDRAASSPLAEFQNMIKNVKFKPPHLQVTATESGSMLSKCCSSQCAKSISEWSDTKLKTLKEMFKADKIIDTRKLLLAHLKGQRNAGLPTCTYIIYNHGFCPKVLSWKSGISEYILKSVLDHFHSGVVQYTHGNLGHVRQERSHTVAAICWLKSFSEAYGQYSPDENVTVLSYWLNKQVLYNMYKAETVKPHVSQSTFYSLFKTKFGPRRLDKSLPWIRISKDSTHSVCSTCVALNNAQSQCKTEEELSVIRDLKNNHRMNFGGARKKVEEIRQSAVSFPNDHMFVQIGRPS